MTLQLRRMKLNSNDVVALFTSTPTDLMLKIIRDKLSKHQDLKKRTLLTVDDIIELTEFSLVSVVYFSYGGQIYR